MCIHKWNTTQKVVLDEKKIFHKIVYNYCENPNMHKILFLVVTLIKKLIYTSVVINGKAWRCILFGYVIRCTVTSSRKCFKSLWTCQIKSSFLNELINMIIFLQKVWLLSSSTIKVEASNKGRSGSPVRKGNLQAYFKESVGGFHSWGAGSVCV